MRPLVDGHNAIFRLGLAGADAAGLRAELLRRVARVASQATVFFDAQGSSVSAPSVEREGGLDVRFCRGAEADEAILEAVRAAAQPGQLLVVSDDRELAGRARQLGARSAGVREFLEPKGAADAPDPEPAAPRGAARDDRRYTAADFGLPSVIDLRAPGAWLAEGTGGSHVPEPPSPAAPPSPASMVPAVARPRAARRRAPPPWRPRSRAAGPCGTCSCAPIPPSPSARRPSRAARCGST